uniref:Uncharacterized protein n=4 Tax=Clytia hemisphaerica TaxID=252671 RepID=A0A7M5WRU4_9CNID
AIYKTSGPSLRKLTKSTTPSTEMVETPPPREPNIDYVGPVTRWLKLLPTIKVYPTLPKTKRIEYPNEIVVKTTQRTFTYPSTKQSVNKNEKMEITNSPNEILGDITPKITSSDSTNKVSENNNGKTEPTNSPNEIVVESSPRVDYEIMSHPPTKAIGNSLIEMSSPEIDYSNRPTDSTKAEQKNNVEFTSLLSIENEHQSTKIPGVGESKEQAKTSSPNIEYKLTREAKIDNNSIETTSNSNHRGEISNGRKTPTRTTSVDVNSIETSSRTDLPITRHHPNKSIKEGHAIGTNTLTDNNDIDLTIDLETPTPHTSRVFDKLAIRQKTTKIPSNLFTNYKDLSNNLENPTKEISTDDISNWRQVDKTLSPTRTLNSKDNDLSNNYEISPNDNIQTTNDISKWTQVDKTSSLTKTPNIKDTDSNKNLKISPTDNLKKTNDISKWTQVDKTSSLTETSNRKDINSTNNLDISPTESIKVTDDISKWVPIAKTSSPTKTLNNKDIDLPNSLEISSTDDIQTTNEISKWAQVDKTSSPTKTSNIKDTDANENLKTSPTKNTKNTDDNSKRTQVDETSSLTKTPNKKDNGSNKNLKISPTDNLKKTDENSKWTQVDETSSPTKSIDASTETPEESFSSSNTEGGFIDLSDLLWESLKFFEENYESTTEQPNELSSTQMPTTEDFEDFYTYSRGTKKATTDSIPFETIPTIFVDSHSSTKNSNVKTNPTILTETTDFTEIKTTSTSKDKTPYSVKPETTGNNIEIDSKNPTDTITGTPDPMKTREHITGKTLTGSSNNLLFGISTATLSQSPTETPEESFSSSNTKNHFIDLSDLLWESLKFYEENYGSTTELPNELGSTQMPTTEDSALITGTNSMPLKSVPTTSVISYFPTSENSEFKRHPIVSTKANGKTKILETSSSKDPTTLKKTDRSDQVKETPDVMKTIESLPGKTDDLSTLIESGSGWTTKSAITKPTNSELTDNVSTRILNIYSTRQPNTKNKLEDKTTVEDIQPTVVPSFIVSTRHKAIDTYSKIYQTNERGTSETSSTAKPDFPNFPKSRPEGSSNVHTSSVKRLTNRPHTIIPTGRLTISLENIKTGFRNDIKTMTPIFQNDKNEKTPSIQHKTKTNQITTKLDEGPDSINKKVTQQPPEQANTYQPLDYTSMVDIRRKPFTNTDYLMDGNPGKLGKGTVFVRGGDLSTTTPLTNDKTETSEQNPKTTKAPFYQTSSSPSVDDAITNINDETKSSPTPSINSKGKSGSTIATYNLDKNKFTSSNSEDSEESKSKENRNRPENTRNPFQTYAKVDRNSSPNNVDPIAVHTQLSNVIKTSTSAETTKPDQSITVIDTQNTEIPHKALITRAWKPIKTRPFLPSYIGKHLKTTSKISTIPPPPPCKRIPVSPSQEDPPCIENSNPHQLPDITENLKVPKPSDPSTSKDNTLIELLYLAIVLPLAILVIGGAIILFFLRRQTRQTYDVANV